MSRISFNRKRVKLKQLLGIRARLALLALMLVVPLMLERARSLEDTRAKEIAAASVEFSSLVKHSADAQSEVISAVYARLARAQVLKVKELEYVLAARSMGASHFRIMRRHVLPNILQPLIVQAAIGMAGAVLAEATLSFLGLGIPAPAASWGSMLNDARSHLFDSPHLVFFPAMAVMLCVLSFNFIGDALRDYLDPRMRLSAGL